MAAPAEILSNAVATRPTSALSVFADLPREHGFEPLRVEGRLPTGLDGTLFRNGPGQFGSQGRRYTHWFDGDGAITAVRFRAGRAEGAARFIQTRGLREERERGRALFGGYGTTSPRGALVRFITSDRRGIERLLDAKNAANTSVMLDHGRLLALWEGGKPTAVDPETLSTLGETDLGGVVHTFSAHPHDVPQRRTTYNFGVRYGMRTELEVYERPEGGAFKKLGRILLPGATLVHDFVVTARHIIVFAAPLRLRLWRTALNIGSPSDNLIWRPELGGELLVAPIDNLDAVKRIPTDPRFVWHFANAYEDSGGIVADLIAYDDFSSNEMLATLPTKKPRGEITGRLTRVSIDHRGRSARWDALSDTICEFPTIAPRVAGAAHRFVYVAAHASKQAAREDLHDRIVKLDLQQKREEVLVIGPGRYPGEPLFVPRGSGAEEDDGWLLTLVYDAGTHTSHVAVIDARRLADGPIATVWFDHHVPPSFHGTWSPGAPSGATPGMIT